MVLANNKVNSILNTYADLLDTLFTDRSVSCDIYTNHGFNSLAVVGVDIPEGVTLPDMPKGFLYKDNDRVFICIDNKIDLEVRNFAKAYLMAVYLINGKSLKDGICESLFYYPEIMKQSNTDEILFLARNILLPKEELLSVTENIQRLNAGDKPDDLRKKMLKHLDAIYHVPSGVIKEQLKELGIIEKSTKNIKTGRYAKGLVEQVIGLLDNAIHTVSWETFESCKIMLDYVAPALNYSNCKVETVSEEVAEIGGQDEETDSSTTTESTTEVDIDKVLYDYMLENGITALGVTVSNGKIVKTPNVDMSFKANQTCDWTSGDLISKLDDLFEMLKDSDKILQEYGNQLSEIDKKCNDCLHALEFSEPEDREKLTEELLAILQTRRVLKNNMCVCKNFMQLLKSPDYQSVVEGFRLMKGKSLATARKLISKVNYRGIEADED